MASKKKIATLIGIIGILLVVLGVMKKKKAEEEEEEKSRVEMIRDKVEDLEHELRGGSDDTGRASEIARDIRKQVRKLEERVAER